MNVLLLVNLAATLFLTGLVWFLQLVHLPLLFRIGPAELNGYVAVHRRRNTWLMAGPMLAEVYTATRLWWDRPAELPRSSLFAAWLLLVIVWIVTFAWHMPQYLRLRRAHDNKGIRGLIFSNWVRTACWTGRSAIMLWITAGKLGI